MVDYDKVGFLAIRDGKVLLCKKKHSTALLILPGGCREPGESAMECLHRELREELGDVEVKSAELVGVYCDQAAGSPGGVTKTVRIELYSGELIGEPAPHAEIAELIWFGENDERSCLAPSIRNKILPDLIKRGMLPWHVSARVTTSL